ncbi:hypothetical protein P3F01_15570 [Clostridium perfringens]|uniref:hypothetical protein n=1 Tax=Clostridium perfringens TaxID=1502 RepID=UPI0028E0CFC3|nr:hypothetical protein [Clostridium perfringens]MDT9337778.1 hypothetical protein [Clostridium perfringens]MDT9345535.1 hypothetical protein [Clostridium perfringens]MDT9348778.1 hypothetical protein [Clostridium perfringens]MDT9354620.1 hypothetical protein [Clostridium perfringens]
MSKFLVYQANKNIKPSLVNKSLRKDNKIFACLFERNTKLGIRKKLVVYTSDSIHFYRVEDFRISKNQKLNRKILGVIGNE